MPLAELRCSFCSRPQKLSRKFIAGPSVYICAECVEQFTPLLTHESRSELESPLVCSFCAKSRTQLKKLFSGPSASICNECVELCGEIVKEEDECSFCGGSEREVLRSGVLSICRNCADYGRARLRGISRPNSPFGAVIEMGSALDGPNCGFCSANARQRPIVVSTLAAICSSCLERAAD